MSKKTRSFLMIRTAYLIALHLFTALFVQAQGIIPGRYIVTFEPKVTNSKANAQQLAHAHGFKTRQVYHHALNGMLIEVSPEAGPALMNALRRNPMIRSIVPDRQVSLTAQTAPKGVRRVDAVKGIGVRANTGIGIDVAVMDSGIDSTIRDLHVDTTRNATCIDGNPCITGPGTGEDGFGHGTSVAGVIAALDNNVDLVGVAPQVNLISVQVFDSNGNSSDGDIIAGIDYLISLNQTNLIEVVNMSFRDICVDANGANAPCAGNADIQPVETALQNLANSGTTIVAAAGNDSIDVKYVEPASSSAAIAVSAMADSNGLPGGGGSAVCVSRIGNFCLQSTPDDSFAPFSNFGSGVHVTAPGTDELMLAKGGGTTRNSGTSFSAPHAAGVAAIFIRDRLNRGEQTPFPGRVRQALIQTGECYQSGSGAGNLFYGTTGCPSVWPGDPDGIGEPIVRADNIANYVPPIPVHDVAVTSVQPPSPVLINSPKTVVVTVANQGTEKETFSVSLTDNLAAAISAAQSVTLFPGASASLNFSFAPIQMGNHLLTATAGPVPNETDTADNTMSALCAVTDVAVTTVNAPSPIIQGDTANIAVTVQNLGSVGHTVTVTIADAPPMGSAAGSVNCPAPFNVAAGATQTVNCSWNTAGAGVGTHTLTVTANNGSANYSVPVTSVVFIPGAVAFVKTDTQTQGTWKGVYGAEGVAITNDVTNYPAYAQVSMSGQTPATWAASTTDIRALQKGSPTATDRIASTWWSSTSFNINVNLVDGNWHRVGIYCLDWDYNGRVERIDVLDSNSSAVLDSRSLSSFANGTYLVWNLKGSVSIRITLTGGGNVVASGIFFDPPASPDFSISASPTSQNVARGSNTTYNLTISPTLGFNGTVTFSATGLPTGASASFSPASVVGSGSSTMTVTTGATTPAGNSMINIVGTSGSLTHSTPVSLYVTVSVPAAAVFSATDVLTKGTWKGVYGAEGVAITNDVTNYPAYAQVSMSGQTPATWAASTTDIRALQKGSPTATDRIASTWWSSTSFNINVNLVDGNWHRVGIYCLDWDYNGRVERIDVLDSNSSAVLDSRSLSSFANGTYLVWNLKGSVSIRITLTGGGNVVASGIFFDPPGPPDFSISASPTSQTVARGSNTTYNLTISPTPGLGTVTFSATGLPTGASASFSPASVVGSGSSTMTVTTGATTPTGNFSINAVGTSGSLSHSTPVNLSVIISVPAAASFYKTDTQTQGTWKGVYGAEGVAITNDVTNYPAYAQVSMSGQTPATWAASTTDIRALQKGSPTATDRIASTWWSSTSFNINVNLVDGNWHRVGIYCLDWDYNGRVERIDVLDSNSSAVLDSRSLSSFANGTYLVWNLKGSVSIRITLTGGGNVVASGIFFDPPASPDFSISASPTSQNVARGSNTTYNLTISPTLGFNGTVTFSATGLPTGASASFSPASVVGSGSSTMTVTTGATTPAGNSMINIVGTSGSLTHSTPVSLYVTVSVPAAAVFSATDVLTKGTWKGVYGAEGVAITNDVTNYPAYAQVSMSGQTPATWAASTTDIRALQKGSPTATDRIASTWYTNTNFTTSFTIDINLVDGNAHQIAFYCLDWDYNGRAERIDVLDASTNSVLDTRTISGFSNGIYMIWNLSGHVKIQITLTGGGNAVLSGIFFK